MTTTTSKPHVIVVGGGLAGLSAACKAIAEGAYVTLIEKEMLGGNSAKATSGINAVHTTHQLELIKSGHFNDTVDLFINDTLKAGHQLNKKELVETLARMSGEAVDSLEKEFGLILSDIQQLGGHSAKRTHRFPAKDGRVLPVGFTVVNTIKKHFLTQVEAKNAELLQKTALIDFNLEKRPDGTPAVTSILIKDLTDDTTRTITDFSALILAAGGYAADSSAGSVLAHHRPDLVGLPTTNGDFASGDIIKIAKKHGIACVHLDKVQLHPTGFVDPKDPLARRKFLCPEVMRGVGAILVDASGKRFVDELKPRDLVAEALMKHGGSTLDWRLSDKADKQHIALMLMSQSVAEAFGMAAFGFYMQKGFIFDISDGALLKKHVPGVDMTELQRTIEQYNLACEGQADDQYGKTVFPQKFELEKDEKLYGAFVTPSLHYAMGGIDIDASSHALMEGSGSAVANLFVAGEAAGGVHGGNRLGGNGCLESLVFGRLAGRMAVRV